jgi:hypothetical protein
LWLLDADVIIDLLSLNILDNLVNIHKVFAASTVINEESLTFCSCDAAVIRILPVLDISHRGISVETLLKSSGLQSSNLKDRHTEQYFKNNLDIGKKNKIYFFNSKKSEYKKK